MVLSTAILLLVAITGPFGKAAPAPARDAALQVLHAFSGADGALPGAGLLVGKGGVLYGTTEAGGTKNLGTVYELTPSGSGYVETVLHSFVGGAHDGAQSVAPLIHGKSGVLYGTTVNGGIHGTSFGESHYIGCGTIFALTPSASGYSERIVYRFKGGASDGFNPYGSVAASANGTLHGTTMFGGPPGYGTVFGITSSDAERVEYSFPYDSNEPNWPDGALPRGAIAIDAGGTIYGAAPFGGVGTCPQYQLVRCGVVYALVPSPSGYTYSPIYSFAGGNDGWYPAGGVVIAADGALYGTTELGGPTNQGTVFKLTPTPSGYVESILYAFAGGSDGALPVSGVVVDGKGDIYGTTSTGGSTNAGTIFQLAPSGSGYVERVLYSFTGGNDGAQPVASLVLGNSGMLFGAALTGGQYGAGTVFALTK